MTEIQKLIKSWANCKKQPMVIGSALVWFNKKDQYHRTDGPAVSNYKGKFWYKNGKLHREDGPAAEYINGKKMWYRSGKLHNEDGPAVIDRSGKEFFYYKGKKSGKLKGKK